MLYVAHYAKQNSSVLFGLFHRFNQKNCLHQIKTFRKDLPLFEVIEKKILTTSWFLSKSYFLYFEVKFMSISGEKPSKYLKSLVLLYAAQFEEQNIYRLYLFRLTGFNKKKKFHHIKSLLQDLPILRKIAFWVIFSYFLR